MPTMEDVRCQCCGVPGDLRALTITFAKDDSTSVLCELCEGLIAAGLLRAETVDGRRRYRQWHLQEMVPGELLPDPTSAGASA